MNDAEDQVRDALVKIILDGGDEIERAVKNGPRATLDAIDRLVATLNAHGDVIALVLALGGCGNPDCPNCGQAARDPVATPSPLN